MTSTVVWVLYDGDCRVCTRWQLSVLQQTFAGFTVCGVSQRTPLGEQLVALARQYDATTYFSQAPQPLEGVWVFCTPLEETLSELASPPLTDSLEGFHTLATRLLNTPAMAGEGAWRAFWGGEGVCWLYRALVPTSGRQALGQRVQKMFASVAYEAYQVPLTAWVFHAGYRLLTMIRKYLP
ncbi:MAG: hypothetical protein ACKO37_02510 [Vampirovibrionales bacterium]